MRRTLILVSLLSAFATSARSETLVVSTSPSGAATMYTQGNAGDPNPRVTLQGGMLESYSDGRYSVHTAAPDVVFPVVAPAGAVLESAVLNLHVAVAQIVRGDPTLYALGYLDDDGSVQISDFSKPGTYVGSSQPLGNLGDPYHYVDVLVSIDVTAFMRSAADHQAPFVGFFLGAGGGSASIYGNSNSYGGDASATAPRLVSTFEVVPEPSALAMGATAVLVGLAMRRRA